MSPEWIDKKADAYVKLRPFLWVATYPGDAINVKHDWQNTCRPFVWSPTKPAERIINPRMYWDHPSVESFLLVWEQLEKKFYPHRII